ncbi:MAG: hypothetical protein KA479_03320 [Saprospiraceae bacterium]|nr:hypothetical protein [Saprospiraceae bacterium]
MKLKFYFLTFMLLFSRGCDFYSTSLWFFQPNGMAGEMNPLTRYLGVGWNGLVITNAILIGLIIYAFYYFTFRYKPIRLTTIPDNLIDYVSVIYYNEKGRLHLLFYKTPLHKKTFLAHSGYVLVRVVIIASFLATIHNLCQFYNVPVYNTFREIVGRPLYVIYGLMIGSMLYFYYRIWKKEFEWARFV